MDTLARRQRAAAIVFAFTAMFCVNARGQGADSWRQEIPAPIYNLQPGWIDMYWKTWELAHDHVKQQAGLPQSPYMDEAFDDSTIWIWDTAFMTHFTKYAPNSFPGVESFDNFYVPMFVNSSQQNATYPLKIQHPDNPPLFAWSELANFRMQNDETRVQGLISQSKYLQEAFAWFDTVGPGVTIRSANGSSVPTSITRVTDVNGLLKGYKWSGTPSGMDNTPRGRGVGWSDMLWIDAISQQALAAKSIVELANAVGDAAVAAEYQQKYDHIRTTVNELYWDDVDGMYYDIDQSSVPGNVTFSKVVTPASFWPLLAGIASPEQAARMAEHVKNPDELGGEVPWTTVARNDPAFNVNGEYWRGSMWLPTAYMGIKALEEYGYHDLADQTAEQIVAHMYATYTNPEALALNGGRPTIWENYDPTEPLPGSNNGDDDSPPAQRDYRSRPDFTGWSALGPISLFIENVLGFDVDAANNAVVWRLDDLDEVGIRGLKFGDVDTTIISHGDGKATVSSNAPYNLIINGSSFAIQEGDNELTGFEFDELLSTLGDVNMDGVVSGTGFGDPGTDDFAAFVAGYGQRAVIGEASWRKGDLNQDGVTDLRDFRLLRRGFAEENVPLPHGFNALLVPEAGSLVLSSVAMLALSLISR